MDPDQSEVNPAAEAIVEEVHQEDEMKDVHEEGAVDEEHAMDIDPTPMAVEIKEEPVSTTVSPTLPPATSGISVQNLMAAGVTNPPSIIKVPTSALPPLSTTASNPTMSAIPRPASAGPVRLPPPNAYMPLNMPMAHSATAPAPQPYYGQQHHGMPHHAPMGHQPPQQQQQPQQPPPPQPHPPAQAATAPASSSRMELQDAFAYLDRVKAEFAEQPDVYNRFLQIMREFKANT